MKRIIVIIAALAVCVSAAAQPKAIGARFGYGADNFVGAEFSYEHNLSLFNRADDFLELEIGAFADNNGFKGTAMYNFTIWKPEWTDRGDWGMYLGPGIGAGLLRYYDVAADAYYLRPLIDLEFQFGVEYTFWFPLQVSADIRPFIGYQVNGEGFYPHPFSVNLAARYAF